RHVIEDDAVFYAPSLTAAREMLRTPRGASDSGHTVLAMAGPGLPEAAREAREVAALYGAQAGKALSGEQANKEGWKAAAPQYRVLHLATHGVLNGNNPLYSNLAMNRTGGEESVLSAREILGMNLSAELAVLSACETARGKFRFGEGLIGMSWAFLVAGAPTTVVSQWKVDSAATSRLMVSFHRHLKVPADGPMTARAEAL